MPVLAVKSLESSTRALAGSQAAQQRVSVLSWACEVAGISAPAAATAVAARIVFHMRMFFLPRVCLDGGSSRSHFTCRPVGQLDSLRHLVSCDPVDRLPTRTGEPDVNYT